MWGNPWGVGEWGDTESEMDGLRLAPAKEVRQPVRKCAYLDVLYHDVGTYLLWCAGSE